MLTRNEMNIKKAFIIYYATMDEIQSWGESQLKDNIIELNKIHLLDNLDKALVQVDEFEEGETNNNEVN